MTKPRIVCLDNDLGLKIEKTENGIFGPVFTVTAVTKDKQQSPPLKVYIGDDGQLNFYIRVDA